MRAVVDYWLTGYDWREQEIRLNRFEQYKTDIDRLSIHFLRRPGVGPDPMPLLLTHGWPGSFVEMIGVLPMLSDPAAYGGRPEDAWSDCGQAPEEAIPLDDLITNVMIYWVTSTAHSAARFYSGSRERPFHLAPGPPCGVVTLPKELPMPPRSWAERAFNIKHWTRLPAGGHFAAMEQPALLAADIRTFFRMVREGGKAQETQV
jgi:hypothetical protein